MQSSEELIRVLYDELHHIAQREHRRAGSPNTIQATALISEAYLKIRQREDWDSDRHFLGCAATAMRHIMIDAARARLAGKRAAEVHGYTRAIESQAATAADDEELAGLGDAMRRLALADPRLAQVVDCRFFAGLDERETGFVLGVTDRTVRRLWVQARAILYSGLAIAD
ncbi:ECF-type sigma factor [Sphingomonas sp. LM7]|uniref:ECF-type sigma factor n=1 Tax=Sphingomonas sp. LM7 TaxID=1938607 RepID=UPI0009852E0D|nr:ECF-type sigma factor [Sphingomonas sp. LM7]